MALEVEHTPGMITSDEGIARHVPSRRTALVAIWGRFALVTVLTLVAGWISLSLLLTNIGGEHELPLILEIISVPIVLLTFVLLALPIELFIAAAVSTIAVGTRLVSPTAAIRAYRHSLKLYVGINIAGLLLLAALSTLLGPNPDPELFIIMAVPIALLTCLGTLTIVLRRASANDHHQI